MNAKGFLVIPIALKRGKQHCHALHNLEGFQS